MGFCNTFKLQQHPYIIATPIVPHCCKKTKCKYHKSSCNLNLGPHFRPFTHILVKDMYKETGNNVGFSYEVNFSHLQSHYMGIERIFVGINLSKGLLDSITISIRNIAHMKSLDYEGIPFRCGHHHTHRNLGLDYSLAWKQYKLVLKY